MTVQTSQGVASRLGYGLGRFVRFFLLDQNPTLRWVKRFALASVLLYLSVGLLNGIVSMFMAVLTIGLILLALIKGDFSMFKDIHKSDQKNAPYGRDVFGQELDSWGNVDGNYSSED